MLTTGSKLGPYEIQSPLGAGGMGEAYRGTDSRLGRDVALKFLPEAFARDAERMARFERDAKVLASLKSSRILPRSTAWKNRTTDSTSTQRGESEFSLIRACRPSRFVDLLPYPP